MNRRGFPFAARCSVAWFFPAYGSDPVRAFARADEAFGFACRAVARAGDNEVAWAITSELRDIE